MKYLPSIIISSAILVVGIGGSVTYWKVSQKVLAEKSEEAKIEANNKAGDVAFQQIYLNGCIAKAQSVYDETFKDNSVIAVSNPDLRQWNSNTLSQQAESILENAKDFCLKEYKN